MTADRLFAYIGSNDRLLAGVLHNDPEAAAAILGGVEGGWGMAYAQESRVLLRKHPRSPSEAVELAPLISDVRTRGMVLHASAPGVSAPSSDATPPFRFRTWMFAMTGTTEGWDVGAEVRALPDFLQRNVRSRDPRELLFHRFLSHLRDAGASLEKPVTAVEHATQALARTMLDAEQAALSAGVEVPELAVVARQGRTLVVGALNRPVHMLQIDGETLLPGEAPRRRPSARDAHRYLRAVLVSDASKQPPASGWETLSNRSVRAVDHAWETHEGTLEALTS